MGWRVRLDPVLCQGHGVCESEAPAVFELPKRATTVTVLDPEPGPAQRAAVQAAVRYCPTHAITIEEDD